MAKENVVTTKSGEKSTEPRKKSFIVATLIVLVVILLVVQLAKPKPSVAAYCNTYKAEKVRLSKLPGDTYPSGVFNEELSDAHEFAVSFGKLERVAPADIKPDIATLRNLYQKIHDDPSKAIAASFSGMTAEDAVKQWTTNHCK
jgi:hypothetical protein